MEKKQIEILIDFFFFFLNLIVLRLVEVVIFASQIHIFTEKIIRIMET